MVLKITILAFGYTVQTVEALVEVVFDVFSGNFALVLLAFFLDQQFCQEPIDCQVQECSVVQRTPRMPETRIVTEMCRQFNNSIRKLTNSLEVIVISSGSFLVVAD